MEYNCVYQTRILFSSLIDEFPVFSILQLYKRRKAEYNRLIKTNVGPTQPNCFKTLHYPQPLARLSEHPEKKNKIISDMSQKLLSIKLVKIRALIPHSNLGEKRKTPGGKKKQAQTQLFIVRILLNDFRWVQLSQNLKNI